MKAYLSQAGSIVPDRSSSKISNACLISIIYYRGRVIVTQSSGLNLSQVELFCLSIKSWIEEIYIFLTADLILTVQKYSKIWDFQRESLFKKILLGNIKERREFVFLSQKTNIFMEYLRIQVRNQQQQMHTYEFFSNSNPRTRSFLSPSQKFGCRSLSTSESYPTLTKTTTSDLSSWKKYKNGVDKPMHPKQYKKQPAIKLQDTNSKNQPQTIHKNSKNRPNFQSYYYRDPQKQTQVNTSNQNNDLHVLIRQMKEKIRLLERQNMMLRQQQVEDISLTKKQNEVIYQLETIIKELSNRQESLRNVLNLLKNAKTSKNSQLQCENCANSGSYFGILKQNLSKQVTQAVIKLKEERDFLKKQSNQHQKKIEVLLEESYTKSKTIEQLLSQRFLPNSYLQICAKRNSEINALSELLNGI